MSTRTAPARRYTETYNGVEVFAYIRDGKGSVRLPQPAEGPAASIEVGHVVKVGNMWQATRRDDTGTHYLGAYPALNRALFRFASAEADRRYREAEAAKVQDDGSVVDTFTRTRLTHDDVRALLDQPNGPRRLLVSTTWSSWAGLQEWRLTTLVEPRFPGNAPTLRGVTLSDPHAWVSWDNSVRVYLAEPKK